MKNETVLKITHLEGYAGLRLKDKRDLEIKKGINLLVGRNGSGKSTLTDLVEFICTNKFSQKNLEKRRIHNFLETSYIKPIYETIKREYDEEPPSKRPKTLNKLESICLFELLGQKGGLKIDVPDGDDYMGLWGQINYCLQYNSFFESAPLTIIRRYHASNSKNFKTLRVKTGANIEEGTTSFVFEKLNKEKIIPIKLSDNKQASDSSIYNPLIADITNNLDSKYKDTIQEFIKEEITILNDKLKQFEENLSEKLENYWEQVIKKIRVQTNDEQDQLKFTFILEDGENQITFNTLSDGEKNLFNLIVSINTAKETKPDLIIIDEPEVYMHDDMIRNLVSEINSLTEELPETCIILSTHNTALIEEVAGLDKSKVNLIIFEDKQIYNSEQDIDFINALHNNGVRFSPLMISRKPNLFIENSIEKGSVYCDFYLKFFDSNYQPNIIPIGDSGRVKTYDKFLEIVENIVGTDSLNNKGIIDGDMWLTKESEFKKYLLEGSNLEEIVVQLKSQKEFYIPHTKPNIHYFNCWEIENLYLLDKLLVYWKSPDGELDREKYIKFLKKHKNKICNSWLKTSYKGMLKPIHFDDKLSTFEKKLTHASAELSKITSQSSEIAQRLSDFFDALLEHNLLNWMPGKEVKALLESKKYKFENNDDFNNLEVTQKIRRIIDS